MQICSFSNSRKEAKVSKTNQATKQNEAQICFCLCQAGFWGDYTHFCLLDSQTFPSELWTVTRNPLDYMLGTLVGGARRGSLQCVWGGVPKDHSSLHLQPWWLDGSSLVGKLSRQRSLRLNDTWKLPIIPTSWLIHQTTPPFVHSKIIAHL